MPKCDRCQAEIMWPQPYVAGQRPVNPDNTVHTCANPAPQTEQPAPAPKQAGTAPQPIGVTTTDILGEMTLVWEAFGTKDQMTDQKFDALCRIFISRKMSR